MKFVRQCAAGILIAELLVASVLIVGLMVPLPGKVEFKIVQSGSMEPVLPVGSVVTVVPAPEYRVGDIVTFGGDVGKKIPTTHRIASIEREQGSIRYVTKGDANEERDSGHITYGSIVGKVVVTTPRLGFVLDYARSREGFFYTIVIPAALIILDELITIFQTMRALRRKKGDVLVEDPVQEVVLSPVFRTRASIPLPQSPKRENSAPTLPEQIRAGIDGYRVVLRPTY